MGPRDWNPSDDQAWEREADDHGRRRTTDRMYGWYKVMLLVAFAVMALALLLR